MPQALSGWRLTIEGRAVAIRQPIFEGFGTVAATGQAENLVQAGRFRLLDTEQLVLLDAVSAYMAVVRDDAVL